MASSSSLPAASSASAPKVWPPAAGASAISLRRLAAKVVTFPLSSEPKKSLPLKGSCISPHRITAKAQLNDVVGGSSNHVASPKATAEVLDKRDGKSGKLKPPPAPLSEGAISEFLSQVANLVKLVDSRDIVELQLKQLDCELIIRKKVALPQPPPPAPVVMMQSSPSHVTMPSPVPASAPVAAPPATAALPSPASALPTQSPAPKATKSSHPPLKSPMAGTLYRSPGPGLPQFVKVGDKVKKGQVLCIIEAMKLMNEIEADQAGTIVDILVEDGKAVGVEQPIFIIEP